MNFLKSKTINAAALIAMLGALELNQGVLQKLLSPEQFGWVMIVIAVLMAGLRAVTNEPLSDKGKTPEEGEKQ